MGRAADLIRATLHLGGHAPKQELALQVELAEALAGAGRFYEVAAAYDRAAEPAPEDRAAELTRLSADNYLRSGHLKAGRDAMNKTMAHLGIPLVQGRRRVPLSFLWLRLKILLRGTKFREPTRRIPERAFARAMGHRALVLLPRARRWKWETIGKHKGWRLRLRRPKRIGCSWRCAGTRRSEPSSAWPRRSGSSSNATSSVTRGASVIDWVR